MNEELNKKLAEWAGFRPTTIEGMWAFPIGVKMAATHSSCKFTESLDACFDWLVPEGCYVSFKKAKSGEIEVCLQWKKLERFGHGKTHALALCRAIEKLIDKKE